MSLSWIQPKWLIAVGCVAYMMGIASCLHLQASPNPFNSAMDDTLTLTCKTDGKAYASRKITRIEITRSDKVVVKINYKNEVKIGSGFTPNMEARGHINSNAPQSYLFLTVNSPQATDAGEYHCLVNYLDREMEKKSDTGNVTVHSDDAMWEVRVTTGDRSLAGSNEKVMLTMFGTHAHTLAMELDNEEDNFERGKTDTFYLKTPNIGNPTKIKLETTPVANAVKQNEWFLDKVVVVQTDGAETYTFECNCWFGNRYGKAETKEIEITA